MVKLVQTPLVMDSTVVTVPKGSLIVVHAPCDGAAFEATNASLITNWQETLVIQILGDAVVTF